MDDMPTYRADIDVANDNQMRRKRVIWLSLIALVIFIISFATYYIRSYMFEGLPKLPNKETMWELNLKPNITILDKEGRIIGHRGPFIGEPLKLDDMPDYVANAFLAIEDERFYDHAGIDNIAILRALVTNTKTGEKTQGASTLTQQLVKNMVLTPEKTYRRKVQEMLLARDMEAMLSKPEILELYLNRINLGPQVFGVEAASQQYFGHSARTLSLAEACLLAALPKAPSRYDPTRNFEGALARSHLVLDRMLAIGVVSFSDASTARNNLPVIIDNINPLIDPDIIGHVFDLATERANQRIGNRAKDLIIHTTLDIDRQKMAHAALVKNLKTSGKKHKVSEAALVSVDNEDGAIRVLVGGKDYQESKFNRASQAKRQPGSSFKAFVYAAAIEDGFTPGTIRIDQPLLIGDWSPENYTKRFRGPLTLREALKLSINTIAAQVGSEIGPTHIVELANRFGISSKLRPQYSIALGTSEVTLLDMTTAYSVFANEGMLNNAYLITEITNTAKETLYKRRLPKPNRVYPASYSRQMASMLRDVVDTGTGYGANLGGRSAAGKTGTSQDHRDAWFIGFTDQYTTGVWMGNDDNSPMDEVTGGLFPADLWKTYMLQAHRNLKLNPLKAPKPIVNTPETQAQIAFYKSLSEAFRLERDMANGVSNTTGSSLTTAGR